MSPCSRLSLRLAYFFIVALQTFALGQVNVTTYHNHNSRDGQNTAEKILTLANVNSSTFGNLFLIPVDGQVYAQPLVLSNVNIGGGTHNVVYVATENDSVYALDADTGVQYWKTSFLGPDVTTVSYTDINGCNAIYPQIGITSTPAISTYTGTLYVVAKTKENGTTFVQRLHALDVTNGAEKFGGPVVISATSGANTFSALNQLNRPGLLLEDGHVVIAFGSHCDNNFSPNNLVYQGWVMSYNATTLAQEAVFNAQPDVTDNQSAAAIWMSGGGIASDQNGYLYFATGNGTYGPSVTAPLNYGQSIIKLSGLKQNALSVADWFTPYNQVALSEQDIDVGSGGVLLLPTLPSGRQLLVGMGKQGTLYEIDTNNMGHYCNGCNSDTQIFAEIVNATSGVWGTPAYWKDFLYWVGTGDRGGAGGPLKAFSFNAKTGKISPLPYQSPETFVFPGPSPSVSADADCNGIVWAVDDAAVLHAYQATNLSELYSGSLGSKIGKIKFATPTVANGKVYVGVADGLSVFGLLPAASTNSANASGLQAKR